MGYYRIINITNRLGKRDINKDRELSVEYNIGFTKKIHKIKSGDELIISAKSLPVSAHKLRLNGLANIVEISENEFTRLQKPSAGKKLQEEKKIQKQDNNKTDDDRNTKGEKNTTSTTKKEESNSDKSKGEESDDSNKKTVVSKSKTKKSSYSTIKSDSND